MPQKGDDDEPQSGSFPVAARRAEGAVERLRVNHLLSGPRMTNRMTTSDTNSVTETERATLEDLEGSSRLRVFDGEPQTIKLALDAGERIPPHRHPDRQIVLHLLEGRLRLTVGNDDHEVEAGELVRFDGNQDISPEALEESTAVLVLAKRTGE